ncbi:MAG: hypothetical protein JKY48_17115 [Flavobacteriales bacterium]|nr:hypothetical protein [Flavobacteriales bacterium]
MKLLSSLLTIVLLSLLSIQTSAQSTKDKTIDFLPKEGDFGASIIVEGLIENIRLTSNTNDYGQNILFAKYYLKDDLVLRGGFGLTVNTVNRESADSSGVFLVEVDSSRSNYNVNISAGIEKHLNASKRLDPFLFAQMDLTFIGKTKTDSERRIISSAGTNKTTREIIADGGIAFGLQVGGGFNYFLSQRFSVGSELALRLQYVKLGGTVSDNTTASIGNVNTTSSFVSREDITKTTTINVQPNVLINVSYFF